jgi:hypothetical protein
MATFDTQLDDPLQELAVHLVEVGELPDDPRAEAHDVTSVGAVCSMCGEPIRPRAPEVDLTGASHGKPLALQTLHAECHHAWLTMVESTRAGE